MNVSEIHGARKISGPNVVAGNNKLYWIIS